ncbi:MAG: hypothetical protein NVSMB65_15670 [Chloroflexota bacterium]
MVVNKVCSTSASCVTVVIRRLLSPDKVVYILIMPKEPSCAILGLMPMGKMPLASPLGHAREQADRAAPIADLRLPIQAPPQALRAGRDGRSRRRGPHLVLAVVLVGLDHAMAEHRGRHVGSAGPAQALLPVGRDHRRDVGSATADRPTEDEPLKRRAGQGRGHVVGAHQRDLCLPHIGDLPPVPVPQHRLPRGQDDGRGHAVRRRATPTVCAGPGGALVAKDRRTLGLREPVRGQVDVEQVVGNRREEQIGTDAGGLAQRRQCEARMSVEKTEHGG